MAPLSEQGEIRLVLQEGGAGAGQAVLGQRRWSQSRGCRVEGLQERPVAFCDAVDVVGPHGQSELNPRVPGQLLAQSVGRLHQHDAAGVSPGAESHRDEQGAHTDGATPFGGRCPLLPQRVLDQRDDSGLLDEPACQAVIGA
ncbi:hypothetical protein ACFWGI_06230 [Streptomyces niveus]|uniref:hypothetical protein n=1 Tax=Streptomyces niveus TaxID=193462 RepID=UPI00365EBA3C